jgi:hypothetical protein
MRRRTLYWSRHQRGKAQRAAWSGHAVVERKQLQGSVCRDQCRTAGNPVLHYSGNPAFYSPSRKCSLSGACR